MRKTILHFLLIFLFSVDLFAQQSRQFAFTHFSSFNGLTSNIVNNVIQDRKGYIWLATLDGLQRYDGNRFLTFRNRPGRPETIPGDVVRKVFEDKKGNLWIWVGDKIGTFNTSNFVFSDKPIQGNTEKDPLHIVLLGDNEKGNAVLYIYKKGFYTYDEQSHEFLQTTYQPLLTDSLSFIGYHHDPSTSQFWFASYKGLIMFDARTGNLNYTGHNPDNNIVIQRMWGQKALVNVYGMQGDLFWYATWDLAERGAPHYKTVNMKTGEFNKYSPGLMFKMGYNEVVGLLHQQNGRTWLYGQPFIIGLAENSLPFIIRNEYKDEQDIKFDKANDLYEDRQHNIWISTNNGVFLFNPDAQAFVNCNMLRADGSGTIDGPSLCSLQLNDGRVIIGSWGNGIYFYDAQFNPLDLPPSLKKFTGPDAIWSLIQQKKTGLVWMGLQGGGLIVYDPLTDKADHFDPVLVAGSTVRQITEDHEGNIWLGMQGGHIVKWDARLAGNDIRKGFVQIKERRNGFINKMYTDRKGFIWMASEADGVHKFDPATNKEIAHFTVAAVPGKRLWSNTCNDILQYNDSIMLIAGGAINILNLNTNAISHITTADGLPSNTVYSFERDKKGLLWLGLAHGLCQVNLEKKIFTTYDRRDGIRYDNFQQAGAFKMHDGRLLFTTEHSFIVFDPAKITGTPKPGDVTITAFKLGNKLLSIDSLNKRGNAILGYNNTSIVIEFGSLNFVRQNKVHYYYMLKGVDKDWQENNEWNQAVYNHLPAGTFTFMVKAENAEGVSSDKITEFVIKVNPPFWKTWWFLGLTIFVAIALFYWLDKQRMQKIKATESVRNRIATSLTEDLSNSLSSINISSELAKTKVDADPQRTKEYINQISEASNRMIQSMYDMVWSINPQNDTMQDTIDRMKAYAGEIENLHGLDIVFDISEEVSRLDLNMEYRYELLSIFKEAMDNIGKHAQARHAHVNLQYQKPKLIMLIEDDGKGFDADAAAAKRGITDMRRRAAAINASFYLESEVNTGTILKLVMPVG